MDILVIKNHLYGVNFGMIICCVLMNILVILASLTNKNPIKKHKYFVYFSSSFMASMLFDAITYIFEGKAQLVNLLWILSILSYAGTVSAVYFFYIYIKLYYCKDSKEGVYDVGDLLIRIYLIVDMILFSCSIWTGMLFSIDQFGEYHAGPFNYLNAVFLCPPTFISMIRIICNYRMTNIKQAMIHLSYTLAYLGFGLLDIFCGSTMHYLAMTVSIALIYILVELENDRILEKKEKELIFSELNALRLHLNPHFIFNTLGSIDVLCVVDPKKAREMNRYLIAYLRSTYLKNSSLEIPITEELKNIEAYVSIEEIRFPDVVVRFDIRCEDFMIPPMVLQPIVENAIKHGIREKEDGSGTIIISTFETENDYHVTVVDNGVGFDLDKMNEKTDRMHIGVNNTIKRLELLCNGHLDIESNIGKGTKVDIVIPKKENH